MRSVFFGLSGFIGRITTESRVAIWAEDPSEHNFDSSRLIEIDLSLTPSTAAAQRISWDAVEVDDCIVLPRGNLGGTTIGPRWPDLHIVGAVYLEETRWKRLPNSIRPDFPPRNAIGHPYEYTTAVYWPDVDDPRAGRRYVGHHAEIVEERGSLARVSVFPPGTSQRAGAQPKTAWINLSAPDQCGFGRDSLTEIGVGSAPKRGALYLSAGTVSKVLASLADLTNLAGADTSETLDMLLSHTSTAPYPKIPQACGW